MTDGVLGVARYGVGRVITVLVADDEPLMRSALRMSLSAEPGIEVVGEASNGREAVAIAERLRPDVVIMDIRMPNLDGIAATRHLTAPGAAGRSKVLLITTFDLDEYIVEGLRAGAGGFLLKDATPDELVNAVRVVAAGEALLSPRVTRRLLDLLAHRLPPVRPAASVLAALTPREVEVLSLVAQGRSNADIARSLHLAESSVKSHVGHLLGKLGLADRVHLVIFAYDNGLTWPGRHTAPDRVATDRTDRRPRHPATGHPDDGSTRDTNEARTAAPAAAGTVGRVRSPVAHLTAS